MASRKDLSKSLSRTQPKPALRRGQGVRLSTDVPQDVPDPGQDAATVPSHDREIAKSHDREIAKVRDHANAQVRDHEIAQSHNRTEMKPEPKRVSRGYKLREDLIKACKRLALEDDRALYEIMEEALEAYLASRANTPR